MRSLCSLAALPLLTFILLASCNRQEGRDAAPAGTARAAHALTGSPTCAGTDVHDVHVRQFRCDTCHPSGAAFGFDVPFTFAGGTTTAGGTITLATATTPTSCTVACHFPKGGTPAAVTWTTPGPLACTTCHQAPRLPATHPPVAANAARSECESCHGMGSHMTGTVVVTGHDPTWMVATSGDFHATPANEGLASCRGCHGADLTGSAGPACASCHDGTTAKRWDTCTMCHGGTDGPSGAPPVATWGHRDDAVRVGAHTKHLSASAIAPAAACSDCHPTPADVFAVGHLDGGTAEVVFSSGAAATWDRVAATCSSTWCHAGAAGGTKPVPVWTSTGGGEGACGACHGLPPPAPHPATTGELAGCVPCHSLSMAAPGVVIAPSQGGLHLNGTVEATGGHPAAFKDPSSAEFHAYAANRGLAACQACHGQALDGVGGSTSVSCATCHGPGLITSCTGCHGTTGGDGAPPRATWGGASDPLRVGAHAKHVNGGAIGGPIACDVCHVVPADAFAPGHLGEAPAEVRFVGVAAASGATPAWDRASGTCSSTYCHGTYSGVFEYWFWEEARTFPYARAGGAASWTGGPMTCNSCHGSPPADGASWHSGLHGSRGSDQYCNTCHPGVDALGTALTDRTAHLNGVIDVRGSGSGCLNCH